MCNGVSRKNAFEIYRPLESRVPQKFDLFKDEIIASYSFSKALQKLIFIPMKYSFIQTKVQKIIFGANSFAYPCDKNSTTQLVNKLYSKYTIIHTGISRLMARACGLVPN